MLVVGCLNIPLSIFCLPWMHAVLPHSPLHVRALADIDEHVEEGHVYDIIVKVGGKVQDKSSFCKLNSTVLKFLLSFHKDI